MSQAVIGNLQVRMGLDSAEFANGVRSVQGSLATLGSSLRTFATATAAITVFQQAVTALRDVADLGDVAEAIGLTAEQIQVYQKMALASGASSDVMMRGLQSIAEQSVDTSSKLSQLFTANGLVLAGKEMNQIILEFMTLLQNAKTPAEQLAIATGVLGDKVGRQLVESLRSGASGWNEAFNGMVADGWYLTNEQVKAAQAIETKYNQVLSNLSSAWRIFVVQVAEGMAAVANPDMGSSANKFRYNFGLGVAKGVPSNAGSTAAMGGKGDLPGNINPGSGYSVNKPTANPFNGISAPKPSLVPKIEPGTIEDIYGAGEAVTRLQDTIVEAIPQSDALAESFQNIADTITDTLGYALTGLINGTMSVKDAFKSMAQSISQQLSQLAAELIKSSIFKLLSIAAGGMGGVTVGGMSFGGFYARGGHLGSGQWGIAGENGPEIIRGPANILPMDQMGSASPQMNVTVINNSQSSVNTRQNQNGSLEVIIEDMIADKLTRGGNKIDTALARGYGLRRAGR